MVSGLCHAARDLRVFHKRRRAVQHPQAFQGEYEGVSGKLGTRQGNVDGDNPRHQKEHNAIATMQDLDISRWGALGA
jgi:hypothetical protein